MSNELETLSSLLASVNIRKKFEDILGKKAAGFMSSILSAVNLNTDLKKSDPMSVIAASAIAASLDLPINPALGFSCIVPYKDKEGNILAQFQIQWKGFVQLGQRTGQYLTMNVSPVCEGELVDSNPFTGELVLSRKERKSDKIIGYVAYFKLLNGFEKYLYMTREECEMHGKKYSKSYHKEFSKWQQDFDVMALKTVIKRLLTKWGIMSIEMQTAIQADQAVIKEDGAYEYVDNETGEIEEPNKKGIAGLKMALDKKPAVKLEKSPTALTEFDKKYFDLLASINDAITKEELVQINSQVDGMYNLDQSTMSEKDYLEICALIERRKVKL